jgi:hypothetical protein
MEALLIFFCYWAPISAAVGMIVSIGKLLAGMSRTKLAIICTLFCMAAGILSGVGLTGALAFFLTLLAFLLYALLQAMIRNQDILLHGLAIAFTACTLLIGISSRIIPDAYWAFAERGRTYTRLELEDEYLVMQQNGSIPSLRLWLPWLRSNRQERIEQTSDAGPKLQK